ncbi:MAG: recombinase family protein, partial [Bacillota bacterium]
MGIRQKVQSGLLHGRPRMLGYRSVGEGRWEIEPAEAAVVRWIYQQYLAGIGSMRIAQALLLHEPAELAPEVLEREFGGMTANSVSDRVRWILHNAVYAGYAPLGEELFPGRHEAIIPPAEWHQAQELFGRRRVMGNRSQTSGRYLLSGIIHCAECGGQMWGYSADSYPRGKRRPANPKKRAPGQNRYEYYVCKNASTLQGRSKTCTNWGVAKHRAETAVLDLLRRVALDPATLAEMAPASDDSKDLEAERRQVQASLGRIEQRRKRLLEAMETAPDLEGDLLQRLRELGDEQAWLTLRVAEIERELRSRGAPVSREEMADVLAHLGQAIDLASRDQLRELVRIFVRKVTVNKEKDVHVELYPLG